MVLTIFTNSNANLAFNLLLSDKSSQRHFCVFALSFPGKDALKTIFSSILTQHLKDNNFSNQIQKQAGNLIDAALYLHSRVAQVFLPTAVKFHYVFNLRDLSNIFQVGYK